MCVCVCVCVCVHACMCVCLSVRLSGGSYSSSGNGDRSLKVSFRMVVGCVMQNTIRDGLWQRGQAIEN